MYVYVCAGQPGVLHVHDLVSEERDPGGALPEGGGGRGWGRARAAREGRVDAAEVGQGGAPRCVVASGQVRSCLCGCSAGRTAPGCGTTCGPRCATATLTCAGPRPSATRPGEETTCWYALTEDHWGSIFGNVYECMYVCEVVEDGYLTTKALSRWKRAASSAADAPKLASKRLRPIRGTVE